MHLAIALILALHGVLFIALSGGSTPTISTPQISPALGSPAGPQSQVVTKGPRQVQELAGRTCGWDKNGGCSPRVFEHFSDHANSLSIFTDECSSAKSLMDE